MQWTDESIAFLRDAAAMNRYYETKLAIKDYLLKKLSNNF